MEYQEIIVCLMLGCIGFFVSFFISRTASVAVVLVLAWVPFKVLEYYGLKPDWALFHKLNELLLDLGRGLVELFSNIMSMASVAGMVVFVAGGIGGLVLHMRLKEKR